MCVTVVRPDGTLSRYDTFPGSSHVVARGKLWLRRRPDGELRPRFPGYEPEGTVAFEARTFEESCRLEQVWEVLRS